MASDRLSGELFEEVVVIYLLESVVCAIVVSQITPVVLFLTLHLEVVIDGQHAQERKKWLRTRYQQF